MSSLRIKPYLARLYIAAFLVFIVNKFIARPFVLDQDFPDFVTTIVLSLPNTCEAIIGMSMSAGLLLAAKHRFSPRFDRIPDLWVYLLATLVTAVYVLTQEYEFHNLGGNNVYDPHDVAASFIGLVGMLLVFLRFGIVKQVDRVT